MTLSLTHSVTKCDFDFSVFGALQSFLQTHVSFLTIDQKDEETRYDQQEDKDNGKDMLTHEDVYEGGDNRERIY